MYSTFSHMSVETRPRQSFLNPWSFFEDTCTVDIDRALFGECHVSSIYFRYFRFNSIPKSHRSDISPVCISFIGNHFLLQANACLTCFESTYKRTKKLTHVLSGVKICKLYLLITQIEDAEFRIISSQYDVFVRKYNSHLSH